MIAVQINHRTLRTPAYLAYEREVGALLAGPPEVARLTPLWTKPTIA